MKKNSFSRFLIYFTSSCLILMFAQTASADMSLAAVSQNLMSPISFFTSAVYNICYIIAISLFFAAIAQYRSYRLNSNQTPLNRPITLFILAGILALTPFIAQCSEAAKYTTNRYRS